MARYKPGDKVWLIISEQTYTQCNKILPIGKHSSAILNIAPDWANWVRRYNQCEVYQIEINDFPAGPPWWAVERILEPRHDWYEGDQVGSWNTTRLWKPNREIITG